MKQLSCCSCGRTYSLDQPHWKCSCGGLLDLQYPVQFDPQKIKTRPPTMWRYREALPIEEDNNILSFGEGFTPMLEVPFGKRKVWIKQDHLFPSGSYKDRGAAVLISKAKELGVRRVVEDSSGNAGCAVAAYCARAGIECAIYVPQETAAGKLAQIQIYQAELHRIPGSREDTAAAVLKAAETTFYASHSWNPFFFHGTKTFAYEVCEQLGWCAPDTVILPAGNGTLLLGAAIGFDELAQAGIIQHIPRLIGVQSAACAPLQIAFEKGLDAPQKIEKKDTLAEGIAIAEPIRGSQILAAIRRSSGDLITVSEEEIAHSLKQICEQGFYIEPTSAAVTAGVTHYVKTAPRDEVIVSVFTGHGLKATEKMLKLAPHYHSS